MMLLWARSCLFQKNQKPNRYRNLIDGTRHDPDYCSRILLASTFFDFGNQPSLQRNPARWLENYKYWSLPLGCKNAFISWHDRAISLHNYFATLNKKGWHKSHPWFSLQSKTWVHYFRLAVEPCLSPSIKLLVMRSPALRTTFFVSTTLVPLRSVSILSK